MHHLAIQRTEPLGHMIIVRVLVAILLVSTGMLHLTGAWPIRAILDAARIPWPQVWAIAAPVAELAAGLSLFTGAYARIGAALGSIVMLIALYAHFTANWEEKPPLIIPLMTLACCMYVLVRGSGRWGIDSPGPSNPLDDEDDYGPEGARIP